MNSFEPGRLTDFAKAKLLAEQKNRMAADEGASDTSGERPASAAYDFSQLPAYGELTALRASCQAAGLHDPYFQIHDARAGAVTTVGGRILINFASYDYLGLNRHPAVAEAAVRAIERYGTTVSASRVVAGERPVHRELERRLADLHGADDALVFVSGHATNVSTIGYLLGTNDLIAFDACVHNSVIEGARLSGAARIMFPHNDLAALEAMLAERRLRHRRTLIIVEGLYSMDGDAPDLGRLLDLKQRFDCWLMVDEAHSAGVLGSTGRGIAEEQDVDPSRVEIWMGTLSKAFAASGGYIAGSQPLIDVLRTGAPGFVFSVGIAPALAAAAGAAIDTMRNEPKRLARLRENGRLFLECAQNAGLNTGTAIASAIVPVIVQTSLNAVALSNRLLDRGFNVLPIMYPAVPEGSARLRFFVTAAHEADQIKAAVTATAEELSRIRAGLPA